MARKHNITRIAQTATALRLAGNLLYDVRNATVLSDTEADRLQEARFAIIAIADALYQAMEQAERDDGEPCR